MAPLSIGRRALRVPRLIIMSPRSIHKWTFQFNSDDESNRSIELFNLLVRMKWRICTSIYSVFYMFEEIHHYLQRPWKPQRYLYAAGSTIILRHMWKINRIFLGLISCRVEWKRSFSFRFLPLSSLIKAFGILHGVHICQ